MIGIYTGWLISSVIFMMYYIITYAQYETHKILNNKNITKLELVLSAFLFIHFLLVIITNFSYGSNFYDSILTVNILSDIPFYSILSTLFLVFIYISVALYINTMVIQNPYDIKNIIPYFIIGGTISIIINSIPSISLLINNFHYNFYSVRQTVSTIYYFSDLIIFLPIVLIILKASPNKKSSKDEIYDKLRITNTLFIMFFLAYLVFMVTIYLIYPTLCSSIKTHCMIRKILGLGFYMSLITYYLNLKYGSYEVAEQTVLVFLAIIFFYKIILIFITILVTLDKYITIPSTVIKFMNLSLSGIITFLLLIRNCLLPKLLNKIRKDYLRIDTVKVQILKVKDL